MSVQFSAIIQAPEFQHITSVVRATLPVQWRHRHPKVQAAVLEFERCVLTANTLGKQDFLDIYSRLVAALVGTGDTEKLLTTDDTEWFVRILDEPYFRTVMSMLAAYWRAVPDLMTPAEAAELAGGGESTWRRRAASGKIPGAQKRGSQWLIPRSAIEPLDDDE